MIRIFVAQSLILLNAFCIQGCTVTVSSHPSFTSAMNGVSASPGYPTRSPRTISPTAPSPTSNPSPVALQASQTTIAAPIQSQAPHYQMRFSDFVLNSFSQLLMLCAVGGKCK